MSGDIVLDVRDLHTHFFLRRGVVKAVDGVSFSLRRGEVLGLVGESACGKSVTALSLLRLLPQGAARTVQGQVLLDGEDLLTKSDREMRRIRGRKIAMILQDPQTSLNPVFTIGNQLREAIAKHFEGPADTVFQRAVEALRKVKLAAPEQRIHQYPHQLSGGMKQRVVGAIAISCEPQVMIADEPTTALDVTIQLQYLQLLKEIQKDSNMAILFITHDFGVVAKMCDRAHPYTQALIASVPKMNVLVEQLHTIEGQPPEFSDMPEGCRFAPRCAFADDRCRATYPSTYTIGSEHTANCWKLEESA